MKLIDTKINKRLTIDHGRGREQNMRREENFQYKESTQKRQLLNIEKKIK